MPSDGGSLHRDHNARPSPLVNTMHLVLRAIRSNPRIRLRRSMCRRDIVSKLVASEPNVIDPVAFDWDDRGRLWVVVVDYPLGMDGKGAQVDGFGLGRCGFRRLLRTTASLLRDFPFPMASSWCARRDTGDGGPEILFLRDRDGDGRADDREVLYSGFSRAISS